jgi:hypothetical protein
MLENATDFLEFWGTFGKTQVEGHMIALGSVCAYTAY